MNLTVDFTRDPTGRWSADIPELHVAATGDTQGEAVRKALVAVGELLERDPVALAAANAPYDDEPLTEEDLAALAEAYEDIKAGRVISDEDLCRELGLHGSTP